MSNETILTPEDVARIHSELRDPNATEIRKTLARWQLRLIRRVAFDKVEAGEWTLEQASVFCCEPIKRVRDTFARWRKKAADQ